uniref:Polysaccharide pyruvyl transferase domain-containing protein n=1 Tax=Skeletonema marinoi TaxID=267567 RepID=A0A7S2PNK8_9STRA|mmetsp:Transcript_2575/g.4154  ORF Transcript_2575/g.4154 Transcript_2575/m.4154 type:complete len:450 (+) Transcript_2575:158-1507(+)
MNTSGSASAATATLMPSILASRRRFLVQTATAVATTIIFFFNLSTPYYGGNDANTSNASTSFQALHRWQRQRLHQRNKTETSIIRTKCIDEIRKIHDEKLGEFIRKFKRDSSESDGHWNLLAQPSFHSNLGDTLLTEGEEVFFERQQFVHQMCLHYREWPAKNISHCPKHFENAIGNNLAFWHAGGNWGDLWPLPQKLRMNGVASLLKNNFTFVGMPQSIFYRSNATREHHTKLIKQNVLKGLGLSEFELNNSADAMSSVRERLIFTWREKSSFQIAKQLYPFAHNMIVPDIAFQMGEFHPKRPREDLLVDILLLLRNDQESNIGSRSDEAVSLAIGSKNKTFRVADWDDRLQLFGDSNHLNVDTAVELLGLGKIVIVDRLHAGILSYLSGLDFIYIDNISQKLTKTLSTAFERREECHLWERADSLYNAIQQALEYLDNGGGNWGEEV